MSYKLRLNDIDDDDKKFIETKLSIDHDKISTQLFELDCEKENVYIPFNFAHKNFELKRPEKLEYDVMSFKGILRPNQITARDKCVNLLERDGCVILAAQPGFGKTITAIEMICRFNQKTIIFVKQVMITNQWIDALKIYAPTKIVQHLKSGRKINKDADIYILNPLLLKPQPTLEKEMKAIRRRELEHVKFVVVDELHQIVSNVLLKSFFKVQPDYFLGLSATPRRPANDPFQKAIDWFFGGNIIGEKLFHKHDVYMIKTGFTPNEVKFNSATGKMDWNHILTTQSENEERNKMIVNIVASKPKHVWLILVKRVFHAETLKNMFAEKNIPCETLTGTKTTFDRECKILIGTTSKIGVGFDHTPIDALFVAADIVEYFEQFLGRCMRVQNRVPIVYDLEDEFYVLKKHAKFRLKTYIEHGGDIKFHGN